MSFTVKLPLAQSNNLTYEQIETRQGMIKQRVKNLLLTSPGERIMIEDFGCGLRRFLFEPENSGMSESVKETIEAQFDKYLDGVQLLDVQTEIDDQVMAVKVDYLIFTLGVQDSIQIIVKT